VIGPPAQSHQDTLAANIAAVCHRPFSGNQPFALDMAEPREGRINRRGARLGGSPRHRATVSLPAPYRVVRKGNPEPPTFLVLCFGNSLVRPAPRSILPSRPQNLAAAARRGCQGWPPSRPSAGLGLDGHEHGGTLDRSGLQFGVRATDRRDYRGRPLPVVTVRLPPFMRRSSPPLTHNELMTSKGMKGVGYLGRSQRLTGPMCSSK
jgi:hypothetical protein